MRAGQGGGAQTRHTDVIAPKDPHLHGAQLPQVISSNPMGENSPMNPQIPTPFPRTISCTSPSRETCHGQGPCWAPPALPPGPWHSPGGTGNLSRGPHPLAILSSPQKSLGAGTDPPSAPLQHCDTRAGHPFSLELPVCYSKRGIWLERGGRSGGWRQDGLPRRCGPMAPLAPALRPAPRGSRRGADTATFPARR